MNNINKSNLNEKTEIERNLFELHKMLEKNIG